MTRLSVRTMLDWFGNETVPGYDADDSACFSSQLRPSGETHSSTTRPVTWPTSRHRTWGRSLSTTTLRAAASLDRTPRAQPTGPGPARRLSAHTDADGRTVVYTFNGNGPLRFRPSRPARSSPSGAGRAFRCDVGAAVALSGGGGHDATALAYRSGEGREFVDFARVSLRSRCPAVSRRCSFPTGAVYSIQSDSARPAPTTRATASRRSRSSATGSVT